MKANSLLLIAFFSSFALGQEAGVYKEWLSTSSQMNWSSGLVTAEGFGVAPQNKRKEVGQLLACRAAVTDAQRNLLEATQGVRVTVSTKIAKYAAEYDVVNSAVEGVVKGASILEREMGQDDTCKVTMGLFVSGAISNSVYQQRFGKKSNLTTRINNFLQHLLPSVAYAAQTATTPWWQTFSELDNRVSKLENSVLTENPELAQARQQQQPSGLIVDVRGSAFLPSMAPTLLQEDGNVIYPGEQDVLSLRQSGKLLSLYARSLEFALNHPTVGDRPLLLKASVDSKQATSIRFSKENGEKLMGLYKLAFFSQPKVIIVLD